MNLTVSKRRPQPPAYLAETDQIKASAKVYGEKVHKFVSAKWTHPNGHPRCRMCGEEESISPECNREPTKAEYEAFDTKMRAEFPRNYIEKHGDKGVVGYRFLHPGGVPVELKK